MIIFLVIVVSNILIFQNLEKDQKIMQIDHPNQKIKTSDIYNNYEILEHVFTDKISKYDNDGFFSEIYIASLQATYHVIYNLIALNRSGLINESKISNYIMNCYDTDKKIFFDDYANRYLNTDFDLTYYPLNTLLEVNCYAILTLNLLLELDMIDIEGFINFIWSCYNPYTSGFIGRPYEANLEGYFNISTADNTYFAVKTLNILMGNWDDYLAEKNDIIDFIVGLQIDDGRFENDESFKVSGMYFESLSTGAFEPNIVSAYYCVQTLDLLKSIRSMNKETFNSYLAEFYLPEKK